MKVQVKDGLVEAQTRLAAAQFLATDVACFLCDVGVAARPLAVMDVYLVGLDHGEDELADFR
jgi:hypothetical protein